MGKITIGLLRRSSLYFIFILVFAACSSRRQSSVLRENRWDSKHVNLFCTDKDRVLNKISRYQRGEIICAKDQLLLPTGEELNIRFVIKNKNSSDPYEYGYPILERKKGGKLSEEIGLRQDNDAAWISTPFVRIRKNQYFADLDNDGVDEFAILPFHPGSAVYATARIFSLGDKITFWGTGRIEFEDEYNHVLLNCPRCSKFNPDECKKCQ